MEEENIREKQINDKPKRWIYKGKKKERKKEKPHIEVHANTKFPKILTHIWTEHSDATRRIAVPS